MESQSLLWICSSCNHEFKSSKARKQHQKRSRCKATSQAVQDSNIEDTRLKAVIMPGEASLSHSIGESLNPTGYKQNVNPLDQGSSLQKGPNKPTMVDNWECNGCEKYFTTRRNLYFHNRKEHKDPTSCPLCNEKFSSKVKHDTHMKKAHGPKLAPKYLCSKCGKDYLRRDKYLQHFKYCGVTGQKCQNVKSQTRHVCSKCEKSYKHRRSLNAHIKSHHHIVIKVGSSFYNRVSTRIKHLTRASAQRNICRICRKLFRTKQSLKAHNKSFHAKTQGKTVNINGNFIVLEDITETNYHLQKCTFCDRKFQDKNSLEAHLRTDHFGEAVHQCGNCSSLFRSKQSLWEHRTRHHRGHIWRCTACDKTFNRKDSLKRHMKTHATITKAKKTVDNVSRVEQLRRMRAVMMQFNESISGLTERDRVKMLRDIVSGNPDILETYRQNPLNETDVTDMVRDANLSDRQVLKILTIIRRKWGKHKVTTNIKTVLKERKQLLAHLFTVELLDEKEPVHFLSKNNLPVTR